MGRAKLLLAAIAVASLVAAAYVVASRRMDGSMTSKLGVVVECPAEADARGPIPIIAEIAADSGTYRANESDFADALVVALIRRDAPGLALLSKFNPQAHRSRDQPPLPPDPPRAPDGTLTSEASDTRVTVDRVALSPLDHGAKHDGYAEYTVIAAFATWTDGPKPLVVKHPRRRLAWHDAAPAPAPLPEIRALPEAPKARGIVAAAQVRRGKPYVEGAFRAAIPPTKFEGEVPPPAFVTIFAPRMEVTGGAVGRSFVVTAEVDGGDYVGRFSIPLSELSLSPMKGKYRVYVFAGHETAAPFEVQVP